MAVCRAIEKEVAARARVAVACLQGVGGVMLLAGPGAELKGKLTVPVPVPVPVRCTGNHSRRALLKCTVSGRQIE